MRLRFSPVAGTHGDSLINPGTNPPLKPRKSKQSLPANANSRGKVWVCCVNPTEAPGPERLRPPLPFGPIICAQSWSPPDYCSLYPGSIP
jgi:hypothetical protein